PLLREEHLKALIHGVLRLVRFDLREIGINGRVQHQAVVENEFGIETELALKITVVETWLNGIAVIQTVQTADVSVRIELHVAAGGNVRHASDESFLIKASGNAAGNPRPVVVFIIARDVAHQRRAPYLLICGMKTNAAKRD